MATKRILVAPQKHFDFQTNYSFQQEWLFLPDQERAAAIARQLTFLKFHWWQYLNLRHSNVDDPTPDQMKWIEFDVADGFRRSDILLFGGICETALFSVLRNSYETDKQNCHVAIKECFEKHEKTGVSLSQQKFTVEIYPGSVHEVELGYVYKKMKTLNEKSVVFRALIDAAAQVGVVDPTLQARLHTLREDRNTIHLSEQIARKRQNQQRLSDDDRRRSEAVTEELRVALKTFVEGG